MKLYLLSENLQKKINLINKGISTRTQLPILSNILLKAEKGKLLIESTDLELGIQIEIPVNIEEEGETTIPAKPFSDLINILIEEKISLQTKKGSLEVKTTKTKNTFQTISSEEFPKLFEEKGNLLMTLKKKIIQKELPKILISVSLDLGRPALSGILLKQEEKDKLLFVATDGYRLSLKHNIISNKKEEKKEEINSLIVPARIFREVLSLKEGLSTSRQEGEDINIYTSLQKNQILFESNGTIIVGRLIDSEFPNYEKIIPISSQTKAVFNKEEMQKAVKICAIFARESANIIKFNIKKDKIILSANTQQTGENIAEVDAKIEGEENEIAFNARYLLDFLASLEEEELIFEMTNPLNPGVFKIKDDPTFLHLIMPIRVQS